MSPANKCVLVTGCDSGFGNLAARRLDQFGFVVYAGCLQPTAPPAVALKNSGKNIHIVKLDVTSKQEVDNVVELVKQSGLQLHCVVNNAGIASYIPAEFGHDVDEYVRMFEVNTLGLIRVTLSCLPLLRKSRGRVVNLGSMCGRITFSGIAQYCASKAAVRTFSDGLRREMYQHKVKVVLIEPMMYQTNITNADTLVAQLDRVWRQTQPEVVQDYGGEQFKATFIRRLKISVATSRRHVSEVVDAIEEATTNQTPDVYYKCCSPLERVALWLLEMVSGLGQDVVLTGGTWAKILSYFRVK